MAGYYQRVLSPIGAGLLVLAVLVIAAWWTVRRRPEHMAAVLWCVICGLGTYGLSQVAAKPFVQAKPYDVLKGVELLVPRGSGYGLPIGHAAAAGAVVCGLVLARCWRTALLAFLAGLLLLFAEVYTGATYPSDVAAGAAAGLLIVLVLWPVASRLLLPVVAAIGSSPLAFVIVSRGPVKRPPQRLAKQFGAQRHGQKMPDARAMEALRAATEAARNATMEQGAGKRP